MMCSYMEHQYMACRQHAMETLSLITLCWLGFAQSEGLWILIDRCPHLMTCGPHLTTWRRPCLGLQVFPSCSWPPPGPRGIRGCKERMPKKIDSNMRCLWRGDSRHRGVNQVNSPGALGVLAPPYPSWCVL